ncbi:type 4b pilus protein PilO2, partial [Escherichia coli]|nr:type 4b pilus protein PilO2 [Escherichia coli]
WQYYERLKAEKAALAEAAQKAAEERITPPWLSMPETGDFIRGCSDVWSRLPVSVAGWRYSLAECAATGNSGNLRASYTNIA